jgi:hypothetical protein
MIGTLSAASASMGDEQLRSTGIGVVGEVPWGTQLPDICIEWPEHAAFFLGPPGAVQLSACVPNIEPYSQSLC